MASKDTTAPAKPDLTFIERARRAQIVEHAMAAIAEQGYARASFEVISRRAGISRSLISYHFSGRGELNTEIMRTVYELAEQHIRPQLQGASGARELLERYLRANFSFIATYPIAMAALLSIVIDARTHDVEARPHFGPERPRVEALINILEAGQASGAFGSFDVRAMAMAMLQTVDGAHTLASVVPELTLDDYANQTVDIFLRAVAPRD